MINEFDLKADSWDDNPIHTERSEAIAIILQSMIPLKKNMKALEFGAGTGLLSFLLKDRFSEITLMDTSPEMIRVLKEKISIRGAGHMKPVLIFPGQEDYGGEFDIIYSQMVFHHIGDIDSILQKFSKMLLPEGYLAIADLYPEDGSFHGEDFKGHKGFDPEWLAEKLEIAGFEKIVHQLCYTIKKKTSADENREFPVFLMVAKNSAL